MTFWESRKDQYHNRTRSAHAAHRRQCPSCIAAIHRPNRRRLSDRRCRCSWQTTSAATGTQASWLDHATSLLPYLKGKQRRVLELLIEGNGSQPIPSIAFDRQIGWLPPFKDSVCGIIRQLNEKLTGLKVSQFDNNLRLTRRRRATITAK